ncbi:MAG: phosphatase PAP2 family protein, partial [Gemmatimonadota bacterium]
TALHLAVVQLGSWGLNPALKFTIPRPRPELFDLRGQYAFPAYPSGHSIAVVSVLFTVAWLVHRSGRGTWAYWAVGGFFVINTYSRLYLSVHWPTDMLGGSIVGAIWLAVTLRAFRPLHARPPVGRGLESPGSPGPAELPDRRSTRPPS